VTSARRSNASASRPRYQNFLRQLRSHETVLSRYAAQCADHLSQAAELERDIRAPERRFDITEFVNDIEGMEDLSREIKTMREQRETHLAEAARFDVEARSQISQIRETVASVMNVDQSLVSRMRSVFRGQGITIASILTALGFFISTIVLALTGHKPAPQIPMENQPKGGQSEPAVAAATIGGDQQAVRPIPDTRYEEPEPAVGGVGGAINWMHTQLEWLSAWLCRIVEKLDFEVSTSSPACLSVDTGEETCGVVR
jgi:hypothetical protein